MQLIASKRPGNLMLLAQRNDDGSPIGSSRKRTSCFETSECQKRTFQGRSRTTT